ncbi:transmembrane protein 151B isoform X2 [Dermatophagoides farinae]|uniref:transmembrane protein 151B isoform X2 n=1 Tax=Dermatophagoides farinae TaxID=6954 RepID=UPI003F5E90FC
MENQQQLQQSSSTTTTIPQPPRQQQQQQSNHLQNKLIYGNHIKYPQRQSLRETFMKNSVQQRLYKLHGRCLCLTLLIYGIMLLIFYMQLDNWRQTLIKLNIINGPLSSSSLSKSNKCKTRPYSVQHFGRKCMVHNEDNDNNNNDDNNAYTVECYHCSTRFVLVNGKRIQYVMDHIDQMRQAKPIVWWKAASYHYVRYYNQSACQMVNTTTAAASSSTTEIRSNHITQRRLGRKRIDTRYSNARFQYEDRFNVEDISDRLIDIDRAPITRIRFFKGFVFIDEQSAQEFDRQRTNFFHRNFKLDEYLEIREGIDLDGIDFYDSIITLSTDDDKGLYNWHWYCRPSMFWIFSAILLSWPFRIILEYNTAYVNYRVVKLFGLLNNNQQQTIMDIHQSSQQQQSSCNHRSQSIDNNISLSNYLIAPSYSEAILTCSDNFAQGLNNVPTTTSTTTTTMLDDMNPMKTIEMPLTIDLPSYDEVINMTTTRSSIRQYFTQLFFGNHNHRNNNDDNDNDGRSNSMEKIMKMKRSITIDFCTNNDNNHNNNNRLLGFFTKKYDSTRIADNQNHRLLSLNDNNTTNNFYYNMKPPWQSLQNVVVNV